MHLPVYVCASVHVCLCACLHNVYMFALICGSPAPCEQKPELSAKGNIGGAGAPKNTVEYAHVPDMEGGKTAPTFTIDGQALVPTSDKMLVHWYWHGIGMALTWQGHCIGTGVGIALAPASALHCHCGHI